MLRPYPTDRACKGLLSLITDETLDAYDLSVRYQAKTGKSVSAGAINNFLKLQAVVGYVVRINARYHALTTSEVDAMGGWAEGPVSRYREMPSATYKRDPHGEVMMDVTSNYFRGKGR